MQVMGALSKECREAREESGVRRSALAHAIERGQNVIDRFERGQTWPTGRDIDQLVNAYADLCQIDAYELWARAIDRARTIDRTARMNAAKEKASELGRKHGR